MSLFARLSFAAAAVMLAACESHSIVGPNSSSSAPSSLSVASGHPDAAWVIQGTVLGDRTTTVSTDTGGVASQSTQNERVAGVQIDVSREVRDSSGSAPATVTDTYVGTIVSDANGSFLLTSVPAGYYRLMLTPRSGSPYLPGSAGTEAFNGSGVSSAVVTLHSR